jgi:hypothetical protein
MPYDRQKSFIAMLAMPRRVRILQEFEALGCALFVVIVGCVVEVLLLYLIFALVRQQGEVNMREYGGLCCGTVILGALLVWAGVEMSDRICDGYSEGAFELFGWPGHSLGASKSRFVGEVDTDFLHRGCI